MGAPVRPVIAKQEDRVNRTRYAGALAGAAVAALLAPAAAGAATRQVTMGPPAKAGSSFQKYGADVNDYFPHATRIHIGDKVKFVPTGFHNVDFPAKGKAPDAFAAPTGVTNAGIADAAGSPFWFNGLPQIHLNPALLTGLYGKRVSYDGKRAIESGLPLAPKNKPLTVRFKKAGRFTYYCSLHAGMKGTVTVLKARKRIPSAKKHAKTVAKQIARDLKIAKALPKTKVPAGVVDLGVGGAHGVEYFGMLPAKVTVASGTTLQFRMTKGSFEAHTATFGPGDPMTQPDSYVGTLAKSFEGPALDQRAVYPSDAPGTLATLTPALHGNGFWNSGVLDTSPKSPQPLASSVQFGAASGEYKVPGTYTYYCLIHPFMKGEVVVR
jgi:plastocyanin